MAQQVEHVPGKANKLGNFCPQFFYIFPYKAVALQ